MAHGVVAPFDISELEQAFKKAAVQAEALDTRLEKLVTHSAQLQQNIKGAFDGTIGNVLGKIKTDMQEVFNTKLTLDVDTTKLDGFLSVINDVVDGMRTMVKLSDNGGLELFDPNNLYTTESTLGELQKEYDKVIKKIQEAEKELATPPSAEEAFTRTKRGQKAYTAFMDGSDRNLIKTEFADFSASYDGDAFIRNEIKVLNNRKRILEEFIEWAKMTEGERVQYVLNRLKKALSQEQSEINKIRQEYKSLSSDILSITKQKKTVEEQNVAGRLDDELITLEVQLEKYNNRRTQIEQEYGEHLIDLIEANERKIIDLKTKNLKQRDALDEQLLKELYSTPQGALEYAEHATTVGEMRQAMKYLDAARENTDAADKGALEALTKQYSALKTAIEEAEGKTKDMNTLIATEAAKYARLLEEIHKYEQTLERLKKSDDYNGLNGTAAKTRAEQDAQDLEQYLVVLNERKNAFNANAESIIDANRKFNAKIALDNEIAREKEAAKKKEVANKYSGIAPDTLEMSSNLGLQSLLKGTEDQIKSLTQAKYDLNQSDENYLQKMKELDDQLDVQKRNLEAVNAELKRRKELTEQERNTPDGALAFAKNAHTVNELTQAYKYLDNARKNVNVTTDAGRKKYQELTSEMRNVNRQLQKYQVSLGSTAEKHRALMHTGEQLKRAITSIFSISAIRGYINQLVQVRGEFEKQHRALVAMLQNKDQVDKLWSQTTQLALKSPFSVKELVTYTKQLAAYRVESDKLNETVKMLGDISAGVGVDMQRLILAFGQVKAANFLRGTELRQFSEAGINVLGELSKYFSEVEGRAVTVGEVFERVSKRMVSFADVEEVLKRVTEEGGIFYNMQEIQAETLAGMRSNLNDSIQLMLNDIGMQSEGVLKSGIGFVKDLADNWRDVAAALKMAVPMMLLWNAAAKPSGKNMAKFGESTSWAAKAIKQKIGAQIQDVYALKMADRATMGLTAKQVLLTKALVGTQVVLKTLGNALMTSLPFLAVTAIAALISSLTSASRAAKQLRNELNKFESVGAAEASRMGAQYKQLADTVSDTTKSYTEQQKALKTLKDRYQDILPAHYLEAEAIKSMKGNYDSATEAINNYIAAKTREKKIGKIEEHYGERVEDERIDLTEELKGAFGRAGVDIDRRFLTPIIDEFHKGIKDGLINESNALVELGKIGEKYTGVTPKFIGSFDTSVAAFVDAVAEMNKAIEDIAAEESTFGNNFILAGNDEKIQNKLKEFQEEYKKHIDVIKRYNEDYTSSKLTDSQRQQLEAEFKASEAWLKEMFGDLDWRSVVNNPFILDEKTAAFNKAQWTTMINKIKNEMLPAVKDNEAATNAWLNYIEFLEKQMAKFNAEPFNKEVSSMVLSLQKTMEVPNEVMEGTEWLYVESEEYIDDYVKRISEKVNKIKEDIAEYEYAVTAAAEGINKANLSPLTEEEYNRLKEQLPLLEAFLKLILPYGTEKTPKGPQKKNTFDDRLRVLKSLKKEFDSLTKTFGEFEAKEIAITKFGDEFKEAFAGTGKTINDFRWETQEGILEALDWLAKFGRKADRVKAKHAKAEFAWEVEIEARAKSNKKFSEDIERLFDEYELYKELEDLGISMELPVKILGLELTNLDELKTSIAKKTFLDQIGKVAGIYRTTFDDNTTGYTLDTDKVRSTKDNYRSLTIGTTAEINARKGAWETYIATLQKAITKYESLTDVDMTLLERWMSSDMLYFITGQFDKITVSMEELEEKFSAMFGEDVASTLFGNLRKIEDMEFAEIKDKLRHISELYKKSFSDRTQLMLDYHKDSKDTELLFTNKIAEENEKLSKTTDEAERKKIQANIKELEKMQDEYLNKRTYLYAKNVSELEKELFFNSENYIRMFENVEHATSASLKRMQEDLESFIRTKSGAFSITDWHEVVNKQNELRIALSKTKEPFSELKEILEGIPELKDESGKITQEAVIGLQDLAKDKSISEYYSDLSKQIYDTIDAIEQMRDWMDTLEALSQRQGNKWDETQTNALQNLREEVIQYYGEDIPEALKVLTNAENIASLTLADITNVLEVFKGTATSGGDFEALNALLANLLGNDALVKRYIATLQNLGETYSELFATANKAADAIVDISSAFGEGRENFEAWVSASGDVLGTIGQTVQAAAGFEAARQTAEGFAKTMNTIASSANWIFLVVNILVTVVKTIAQIRQQKIDEAIADHEDAITRLEKKYENLNKLLEKAYDVEQLKRYNEELEHNLRLRQAEAAAAKEAAESGKDSEKNKEEAQKWQDEYDELTSEIADNAEKKFSDMTAGIFDNLISAAESFVDAWLEAYNEVGDGMSGLTEHLEEEMMNLVKRQAALQIVGQYTQHWKDQLDAAFGEDQELSPDEINSWVNSVKEQFPSLNEALKRFFDEFPLTETGELSGLQKGIQGITADQADVLAAYWNSVRFIMSSIDQKFDIPLSTLLSNDVSVNPVLDSLRIIQKNTTEMHELLRGWQTSKNGANAIKVTMV